MLSAWSGNVENGIMSVPELNLPILYVMCGGGECRVISMGAC